MRKSDINSPSVNDALNDLCLSGLVIQGREHIDGLVDRASLSPSDAICMLFERGRAYGIYLYADQVSFDQIEFARKLGEIGFDSDNAKKIIANLRPEPAGEMSKREVF